jgi:hypothetical protein
VLPKKESSVSRAHHTSLPPEVEDIFCEFRTCEMATIASNGSPVTYALAQGVRPPEGRARVGAHRAPFNDERSWHEAAARHWKWMLSR